MTHVTFKMECVSVSIRACLTVVVFHSPSPPQEVLSLQRHSIWFVHGIIPPLYSLSLSKLLSFSPLNNPKTESKTKKHVETPQLWSLCLFEGLFLNAGGLNRFGEWIEFKRSGGKGFI